MRYKLVIPDVPTPLNRLMSMHRGARKRLKGRFNRAVWAARCQAGIPRDYQDTPHKVHVDIEIYVSGGRGRLPDPDGQVKHLFDCLKDNGIIYDDSQKWLSWSPPVIKRDRNNPRTEVVVTPFPPFHD
jgi:Holliday junction resolvase RusA-like endonuclease